MSPSKLSNRPPNPPSQTVPKNSSMPNLQKPPQTETRLVSGVPNHKPNVDSIKHSKLPNTSLNVPHPSNVTPSKVDGKLKRKSWFSGMSKDKEKRGRNIPSPAWIAGQESKVPYKTDTLLNGGPVAELWDDSGDTLVYLHSRDGNKSPSFKIHSSIYTSSTVLTRSALGYEASLSTAHPSTTTITLNSQHRGLVTPPMTPPRQITLTDDPESTPYSHRQQGSGNSGQHLFHLYLDGGPIAQSSSATDDQPLNSLDSKITLRNLFAFLIGQALIGTERRPTVFHIFLSVSHLLSSFGFSNINGSTYGEIAARSFDNYVVELSLCDIRASREKTIEALVLGERMRSVMLYNEAFTHAVGKYSSILQIASLPETSKKFGLLSPVIRNRLERASIDLFHRETSVSTRLLDFEFPSVFAGVMNSKTVSERKYINFDAWKSSFAATRRHVLGYYKHRFGSWPPKAQPRRNNFETHELNRVILKTVYADFCSMYDLFVNRNAPTPRLMGQLYSETSNQGVKLHAFNRPIAHILRRVMDEYDRSSPPVVPPVPFDIPLFAGPTIVSTSTGASHLSNHTFDRTQKLNQAQTQQILRETTNADARPVANPTSPFLSSIASFESRQASGCTMSELVDLRAGMWIFMYAVLQTLPLLVVDGPALQCHHGVEYFLCQPPRGGLPWVKAQTDAEVKARSSISRNASAVNLPSDLIEQGIEGVYHRSHCWTVSWKWMAQFSTLTPNLDPESPRLNREFRRPFEKEIPPSSQAAVDDTMGFSESSNVQAYGSFSAPSSTPSSRAASPGLATRFQLSGRREASVDLTSEALPLLRGVSPVRDTQSVNVQTSSPRLRPDSVDKTFVHPGCPPQRAAVATTFNDIISSMNKSNNKDSQKGTAMK